MRASTTVGSCHSQPAWFSSEPRWWSTANTTVPAGLAAAPSQIVERPQYEPTSTNGAPGHGRRGGERGGVQGVALVGRHEPLGRQRLRPPVRRSSAGAA